MSSAQQRTAVLYTNCLLHYTPTNIGFCEGDTSVSLIPSNRFWMAKEHGLTLSPLNNISLPGCLCSQTGPKP